MRSDTAKRGRADEITRLADLPVEIDGYKNGHATVETVCGFALELSQKIGAAPVGIVESGGRWHVHWAVGGGEIGEDFPVTAAKGLLLCWRALAGLVGANHGITLDPIFDLARVLRLPGTVNAKYRPARPVVAHDLPGGADCAARAAPDPARVRTSANPTEAAACDDGRDGLRGRAG